MHIPDGYLSPSTCATLYSASVPFWYVSLQKLKARLSSRMLPLVSLFAAFSFVVMMFNLPLPGGTTGHAVGMGIAAIILGPSMAICAISLALLVQALLFGDGGITAYGANCFNMAIIGSLTSVAVYKLLSYRADLMSKRRVLAAGVAGYAGINLAALCAAIEFGIQPSLFHDASGSPLYAPYPLSVSIPAMMIGHLTFAGLAEFVLSAGMVAYLQRSDPELLRTTAPNAPAGALFESKRSTLALPISRKLWVILALVLVLTPLGIVTAGSAWGEWRAGDYANPSVRRQIARASGNHAAPSVAPAGLQTMAMLWQAPLSDYAPKFTRNVYLGYFLSACIGVGLIILLSLCSSALLSRILRRRSRRPVSFVEKTLRRLARAAEESLFAEEFARANGLLQALDVRAKIFGLGLLILAVIAVERLQVLMIVLILICLLGLASRITLRLMALRIWIPVLIFTGVIAIPALFLTPGHALTQSPLPITSQGLRTACLLLFRTECAASLVFLLTVTTPWSHILRALGWFRVPPAIVALLEVTYRYAFVLMQTAQDMFESRQTRLIGRMEPHDQRRLASASAAVLLDKALELSREVHLAMLARGFLGDIILMEDPQMTASNWLYAATFAGASMLIIWFGR